MALEFSSERRSVALARGEAVLAEAVEHHGGRGANALGLIEKVLTEAKVDRADIGTIAVGLGPGSYTGIRAAIAVAQGWQLARGVRLLGVSSVESLAAEAQAQKLWGRVNLAIDAQRGEFYLSTWELTESSRKELSALKIVSAPVVAAASAQGEICVGPEMATALFPSAATIARLAAGRSDFVSGEQLVPIYLRETTFVKTPEPRAV
ncbi:MAG TPA: tRNA (adenosine(37)-N6)-threonylcarbamoyltransferase complex dimerization subunit type 1 TsaB [Verrucomicrobiae bacterium]